MFLNDKSRQNSCHQAIVIVGLIQIIFYIMCHVIFANHWEKTNIIELAYEYYNMKFKYLFLSSKPKLI